MTPINSYCASVRYRFAVSEADYLTNLKEQLFAFIGDNATAVSLANVVPHGGINSHSILQCLHDALALKGPLHTGHKQIESYSLLDFALSCDTSSQRLQRSPNFCVAILSGSETCVHDLEL